MPKQHISEHLSIVELKNIYGVTERTLNTWRKTKSLSILEISSQQKFVYKEDLIK